MLKFDFEFDYYLVNSIQVSHHVWVYIVDVYANSTNTTSSYAYRYEVINVLLEPRYAKPKAEATGS